MDEQGVRHRLQDIIARQFGDRRRKRVQRELRWVIEQAGITWNTFYKKLKGDRKIQAADVPVFATVFGINPAWLGTGQGSILDGRPLDPLLVTAGWVTDTSPLVVTIESVTRNDHGDVIVGRRVARKSPRGRQRKRPKQPFGPRVTSPSNVSTEPTSNPPKPVEVDQMTDLLTSKRVLVPEPPSSPRLALLAKLVSTEFAQPKLRRHALAFLLNVAQFLGMQLHECRRDFPLLNELKGELKGALEELDWKEQKGSGGPAAAGPRRKATYAR